MARLLLCLLVFLLVIVLLCSCKEKNQVEQSRAINNFAFDFYKVITSSKDGSGNLFFSPYSIYTALAMVNVGARGETFKQTCKALHWNEFNDLDKDNDGHMEFRRFTKLLKELTVDKKVLKFSTVNRLWLQKYFATEFMKKNFIARLKKFYDAELGIVDFVRNSEQARRDINRWVEKSTENKIKELLKPGVLTSLTRLVLTNAIYFKGTWKTHFDEEKTREMDFHVSEDKKVQVPMMFVKSKFRYSEDTQCKVVELPYSGGKMSMLLIVPQPVTLLKDVVSTLSAQKLRKWTQKLKEEKVSVMIPKFKLETTLNLIEYLQKLGIRDLFDEFYADLSGIIGFKGLYVSDAVHKAFVEVNEKGTEAAAATALTATFRNLDPRRKVVVADQPFLFVIRDNQTGAVIFLGKVENPLA